jgi:UDP-N-acetylglucosamine--N-acetylmuramyl-(pentapeptide) pyrophosphoryl-undecaprenol N-acetylglucosamine transferase
VALTLLPGRGIRRSLSPSAIIDNLAASAALVAAVLVALVKVRKWRPSVVVSLGGYASFAVTLAAAMWRRPIVLVDLDAATGAAHRLLGRFSTVRCSAFPTDEPNDVVTGVPLRESIIAIDRSTSARMIARAACEPPLGDERLVVVVMTGSLGSTTVNRAASDLAARWCNRTDRTLIHVTGRRDYRAVIAARPTTIGLDYRVQEFADMTHLWAVADVAVCRAGATTVAELTTLAIASVLVPLPGSPSDHQLKNAQAVARVGGATIVSDQDCTGARLEEVLSQITDAATLDTMSRLSGTLGRRDGADSIARVVLDVRSEQ